jgi:hypothetical protein
MEAIIVVLFLLYVVFTVGVTVEVRQQAKMFTHMSETKLFLFTLAVFFFWPFMVFFRLGRSLGDA